MPAVSVIIRAKDEAASIGETIRLVQGQTVGAEDVEIIVVDSGSQDDTAEIARAAGAHVVSIPAASFTFGGSLNTGCELATAPIAIALSAHAFPTDERWLERMLEPFSDPTVACVSGDDFAPDGSPLDGRVRQDMALAQRHPDRGYSNAAGAFRMDLWRQHPFRADMPGTEDKEWAWWWLRRGFVHVIGSDLVVDHDHSKDPVRDLYVRGKREWTGYAMYLELEDYTLTELAREWWRDLGTYRSALRARLSHRRAARLLGTYAGRMRRALLAHVGPDAPLRVAVMIDTFPTLSESFVTTEIAELRTLGHQVTVEAVARTEVANWPAAEGLRTAFVSDESRRRKLLNLAWLVANHPLACAGDLVGRRAWGAQEDVAPLRALAGRARRMHRRGVEVMHVHFAARSALEAMRIGRLLGLPYSLTAHAFDIFALPTNLKVKLERAAFVTTGCDYNVAYLQGLVNAAAAARVHKIVMGVDGEAFRRSGPLPGGRTVLGVGRLVPKKGFDTLIEAAALLHAREPLDRVVIVGEGAERARLQALAADLGISDLVAFAGARDPAGVRAALASADVLAMPCIVAADGDRDSMPVVVKEAMAMELLVAASDEVGLPEVVLEPWGRLAPPGDAEALAGALGKLLARSTEDRAAAGGAGRAWVLEHASSAIETARLAGLLGQAAARSSR